MVACTLSINSVCTLCGTNLFNFKDNDSCHQVWGSMDTSSLNLMCQLYILFRESKMYILDDYPNYSGKFENKTKYFQPKDCPSSFIIISNTNIYQRKKN